MARAFLFLSHDNKIGDAIVLTGLFGPIKARWPDAVIGVLCGPSNQLIYRSHPLVDRVHVAPSRSVLARVLASCAARWSGYTDLVHFGSDVDSTSLRTIIRLIHAEQCTLLFEPVRPLARKQTVLQGDWFHCHVSERHLAFARVLGLALPVYRYDLQLPAQARQAAQVWCSLASGPQLVVACDASTADRSFSADWLRACCTAVLAQPFPWQVTLLCAGADRHASLTAMVATLGTPRVRVAPLQADVGLALALVGRAAVLLSPDTFAVHAASAFNIPTVAVYPGDAHTLVTWASRSTLNRQVVAAPGQSLLGNDPVSVAGTCATLLQQSATTSVSPA